MLPPAPARFSITIGWPSASPSGTERIRVTVSCTPPGVNATTIFTGFAGHWAAAGIATARARTAATRCSGVIPLEYPGDDLQPLRPPARRPARIPRAGRGAGRVAARARRGLQPRDGDARRGGLPGRGARQSARDPLRGHPRLSQGLSRALGRDDFHEAPRAHARLSSAEPSAGCRARVPRPHEDAQADPAARGEVRTDPRE